MTTQFRRWTLGIVGTVVLPTALVFTASAASASEPVTAARTSTAAVQTSATTAVQASITQQHRRYHWVRVRYFNSRMACERYNRAFNRGHYRHFCRYERIGHSRYRAWALYWYVPERHR